ncbi:MAG TPA: PKD domain-containing protein [Bacteroidales bacterium]|nr:PKD domain-containing protein [Bacteroidales bacterium]
MKKFTFLFLMLLLQVFLYAQNVARDKVILEIGTGTWCQYCPGAANAADQLVEEGKDVMVIEHHNGDNYDNTYSNYRNDTYYDLSGYPTAHFDGILEEVGGDACPPPFGNVYNNYLYFYNQRMQVASPFALDWCVTHVNGNNYEVNISIAKVGDVATDNTVVHFVVTESHIAANWFCMTECNFVNRLMVPDQYGTALNLTNNVQQISQNFTLDAAWDTDHLEFVCFIQNNTTKEIHQGSGRSFDEMSPPLVTDFTADETQFCQTATVHYIDQTAGCPTNWQWTFTGGTPASSTQQNPTVTYASPGTYDVTLKAWKTGESMTVTKENFVFVGAATPQVPSAPTGESALCKNPPNSVYTTQSGDALSFDWELNPSNAGLVLDDGFSSVTINWFNSFLGEVAITVKAINPCGESAFSEPLTVTISPRPATFHLMGGGDFCEGEPGVEIGLDGSELGVTYQLFKEDQPEGTSIPGTGGPISFGLISDPGEYSSVGFNEITQCDIDMTNTVMVTMIPLPEAYAVTGGGALCVGMEGLTIGLEDSQVICLYELFCNDITTGVIVQGSDEAIDFGQFTTLGTYHVVATHIEAPCTNLMTGTAEITAAPLPETPQAPQGPTAVDLYYSNQSEYETAGSSWSDSYGWELIPPEAGTVEIFEVTHCRVTWNADFLGQAAVCVYGINECGESDLNCMDVTLYTTVGFNMITEEMGIRVSPNPSDGIFTIQMKSAKEEVITVRVISALNAVAFREEQISVNGELNRTIDLSHAPDGIYFLYIETEGSTYMRKLIFQ